MSNIRIKEESEAYWTEYFQSAQRECQYGRNFQNFLDTIRSEQEKKASDHLQPWLQILEDSIQWLANIWGILSRKMEAANNDAYLLSAWSLLSNACNLAVSARLLVISGLDNSARGVVRALDEHLCVCIVILNMPELAKGFQASQFHEDASQFWYDNFNTKRLRKHLNSVERDLGVEAHVSKEFRQWRDEELSYFSQSIHPTFLSGVMAANAIDIENTDIVSVAVLGKLTAGSERTLAYACHSMWYFSRFGFLMLFNEHKGKKPLIQLEKEDEMHQMAVIGRDVLQKLNMKYWEHTNYPEIKNG
jgi:hypothetical protein